MVNYEDVLFKTTSVLSKIEKFIFNYNKLKDDYLNLSSEHQILINKIEEQKKQIAQLEEKNKVIKLANYLNEKEVNTSELKKTINELVREIDKSIELFNKA
ncbi:MAG: hypothetical protein J0M08_11785 [Bacteroidetes bacterium]|nr:hypothetical protein [Bacteroidota bacterium]